MYKAINIFILIILLVVSSLGCGRKSAVKPPEERAPAAVRSIVADPKASSIKLTWQAPIETASGGDLLYLTSFDILRRIVQKNGSSSYKELAVIQAAEDADPESEYSYEDNEVVLGVQYEYLIVPRDDQGIEGTPNQTTRISFLGPGSLIEALPFSVEE